MPKRNGATTLGKHAPLYDHSSLYPALSAAAQYMTAVAGTWDICSLSQKAEILANMEQLTEDVIEVMAANLEHDKRIRRKNR